MHSLEAFGTVFGNLHTVYLLSHESGFTTQPWMDRPVLCLNSPSVQTEYRWILIPDVHYSSFSRRETRKQLCLQA